MLSEKGIIPPEEYNHNPTMRGNYEDTVAARLALKRIIPP